MTNLKIAQRMVEELNTTNSSNDKKTILGKYSACRDILKYTYHPLWKYNVTSDNCKKLSHIIGSDTDLFYSDIESLLDSLRDRKHTGHDAIKEVNTFVDENKEHSELIWNILDRNLKCRIDVKLINKVFPGLIPEFSVALCEKYTSSSLTDLKSGVWYISRKLDGVRCITIKQGGTVKFYSRVGNEFHTLSKLIPEVLRLGDGDFVLDGEICLVDVLGKEDFQGVVSEIKRKDYTIDNPKYKIFDCLTYSEFMDKEGDGTTFFNRILTLSRDMDLIGDFNHLELIEQVMYDEESFELMKRRALDKGWEGLILRKDVSYEGKRTHNMLKYKLFSDAEYVVNGVENGPVRYIKGGKDTEEEMLSAVYIEHKGYKVKVGSGFTIKQRRKFYRKPESIIGRTILVQYFEETKNQDGGISLRFPTVKHIYDAEGRTI